MPTNNMIKPKSPKFTCFQIFNVDAQSLLVEFVIDWCRSFNSWTPRQDAKSNVAQDDEQHNAAKRRRNHKKNTKEKTWYMWKPLI